jgi:predicted nucleotidyltransferase
MAAFNASENNKKIIYTDNQDNKLQFDIALKKVTGSRLYGTQYELGENPLDPNYVSDYDFRGVFILPPALHLSNLHGSLEVAQIVDGEDEEFFELKKFFLMAKDNNPNILDIMFGNEDSVVYQNNIGKMITDNKNLFLSQKIKDSFAGYGLSQLKRIKDHKKMLTNFPDNYIVVDTLTKAFENKDIDFNFIKDRFSGKLAENIADNTGISKTNVPYTLSLQEIEKKYQSKEDTMQFPLKDYMKPQLSEFFTYYDKNFDKITDSKTIDQFNEILKKSGSYTDVKNGIIRITEEGNGIFHKNTGTLIKNPVKDSTTFLANATIDNAKYKSEVNKIDKFWDWKINRNPKRALLEEKFGYDTKHGMHLVRLLSSCKNILLTGDYNPTLQGKDRELVQKIREGQYKYDSLLSKSENLLQDIQNIITSGNTSLPVQANEKGINELMLNIYEEVDFMPNNFQSNKIINKITKKPL